MSAEPGLPAAFRLATRSPRRVIGVDGIRLRHWSQSVPLWEEQCGRRRWAVLVSDNAPDCAHCVAMPRAQAVALSVGQPRPRLSDTQGAVLGALSYSPAFESDNGHGARNSAIQGEGRGAAAPQRLGILRAPHEARIGLIAHA